MVGVDQAALEELREMMAAKVAAVAAKSPHKPRPTSQPVPKVQPEVEVEECQPHDDGRGWREVAPGARPSEGGCSHARGMRYSDPATTPIEDWSCSCGRCGARWKLQTRVTTKGRSPVRWVCVTRGQIGRTGERR